jgi:hypothetical protein
MFVTYEILEKANSCEKGKSWFQKHYPNGAELSELITHRHISKTFLHWGFNNLSPNAEEIELYHKVLGNENSEMLFESDNIINSSMVTYSSNVKNSTSVFRSNDVEDSHIIISSDTIEQSIQVFLATFVYSSEKVFNSNNINNSVNIIDSTYAINSSNIYMSRSITNCKEIRKSESLEDCYFCNDCKNIKHCFGCQGLTEGEYLVFNKPVSPAQFETIKKQYMSIMDCLFQYVREWPTEIYSAEVPSIIRNFTHHYQTIPQKFWKWVKTLPNYSNNHMFYLTSLPEFLTK